MKRRRKILIAIAVVVAAYAAWWLWIERLTAEERKLVGRWRVSAVLDGVVGPAHKDEFATGHRYTAWDETEGRLLIVSEGIWYVEGGELFVDTDASFLKPTIRRVAARLGIRMEGPDRGTYNLTGNRLEMTSPKGAKFIGIRVTAD